MFSSLILSLVLTALHEADTTCTFPSPLRGQWEASDLGTIFFNDTTLSGLSFHKFGPMSYDCEVNNDTLYVSRSEAFIYFSTQFQFAICLDLQEITESKFIYYMPTPILQGTKDRVKLIKEGTNISLYDICTLTQPYDQALHRVMIANGTIDAAKIKCPTDILGRFNYTVDNGTEEWCVNRSDLDVCENRKDMVFNYTQCPEAQASSVNGSLGCVHHETSETATYLTVYNLDSDMENDTDRFSCYAIAKSDDGSVKMTHYPQGCLQDQNATYVPSPGVSLFMTPYITCPIIPTVPTDNTANDELLIYIIIPLVVITVLIVVIVIIVCMKSKYAKKQTRIMPDDSPVQATIERELTNLSAPLSTTMEIPCSPRPSENIVVKYGQKVDNAHAQQIKSNDGDEQESCFDPVSTINEEPAVQTMTSRRHSPGSSPLAGSSPEPPGIITNAFLSTRSDRNPAERTSVDGPSDVTDSMKIIREIAMTPISIIGQCSDNVKGRSNGIRDESNLERKHYGDGDLQMSTDDISTLPQITRTGNNHDNEPQCSTREGSFVAERGQQCKNNLEGDGSHPTEDMLIRDTTRILTLPKKSEHLNGMEIGELSASDAKISTSNTTDSVTAAPTTSINDTSSEAKRIEQTDDNTKMSSVQARSSLFDPSSDAPWQGSTSPFDADAAGSPIAFANVEQMVAPAQHDSTPSRMSRRSLSNTRSTPINTEIDVEDL